MSSFQLKIKNKIAELRFDRPEKANALHADAWREMQTHFENLSRNPEVRVIVLTGEGKHWCAGIDLELLMSLAQLGSINCEGRKRVQVRAFIHELQAAINAIERCRKPVIAAIQGGCIGGGVDIATACDMRYCTEAAYFSVKEIDLGLVADIGTLQRLPKIIQPGMAAEMAYTARKVHGPEAERIGLANRSFPDTEQLRDGVWTIAEAMAQKSPLVTQGIKEVLQYSKEHTTAEGLEYVANYNAAFLLSNDLMAAFQANMSKSKPTFED